MDDVVTLENIGKILKIASVCAKIISPEEANEMGLIDFNDKTSIYFKLIADYLVGENIENKKIEFAMNELLHIYGD